MVDRSTARARVPYGEEDRNSSGRTTHVGCMTDNTFAFKLVTSDRQPGSSVTRKGLMVYTGATSHIIINLAKFRRIDDRFQAETHCVELADGIRCKGIAERRREADVCLIDSRGGISVPH